MATYEFYFKAKNAWNMGPACGNVVNASTNPAPTTNDCIYIIHNSTENSTYVGYADNAANRWAARTEVFHIMGIPRVYAQTILCAYCVPTIDGNYFQNLEGKNNAEHILIRAVVGGLLGPTTNTNTQLANVSITLTKGDVIRVYLPSAPQKWGKLESQKQIVI